MNPSRLLLLAVGLAIALVPCGTRADTAGAAAAAKKPHDLVSTLEVQERRTWDAFVKRDAQAFLEIMSTDSWVIDPTGFTSAANIVETMKDFDLHGYTLDDLKVLSLDKDVVVLGYVARLDATLKGQPMPPGPWYCTTGYVRKGKDWFARYHQESLALAQPPHATDK